MEKTSAVNPLLLVASCTRCVAPSNLQHGQCCDEQSELRGASGPQPSGASTPRGSSDEAPMQPQSYEISPYRCQQSNAAPPCPCPAVKPKSSAVAWEHRSRPRRETPCAMELRSRARQHEQPTSASLCCPTTAKTTSRPAGAITAPTTRTRTTVSLGSRYRSGRAVVRSWSSYGARCRSFADFAVAEVPHRRIGRFSHDRSLRMCAVLCSARALNVSVAC